MEVICNILGGSGRIATYDSLLNWLISRAKVVGRDKAVEELEESVKKSTVRLEQIELLISINFYKEDFPGKTFKDEFQFLNGVKIISLHKISNRNLAERLAKMATRLTYH